MKHARPEHMTRSKRIKFIEAKDPDLALVAELLEECRAVNQWANFGPLYHRLADEYAEHMNIAAGTALTPCANAGIALEMLARALAAKADRPKLRWIGSAFSFKNLGRGYFSDMEFLDCDDRGVLDFAALEQVSPDSFDGFIVTNPFGMCADFDRFIQFAKSTGKELLIDNAAGVGRSIPPWPWQVFSLHHTKPYGMGEGGLALSPESAAGFLQLLINYDKEPGDPSYWLNNGKVSDIACAFQIARLRTVGQWEAKYMEQRQRILEIFKSFGISPLLPIQGTAPINSLPMLIGAPVDKEKLDRPRTVDITRQYEPLADAPRVQQIFAQLINYPTHSDLGQLTDAELVRDIEALLVCRTSG